MGSTVTITAANLSDDVRGVSIFTSFSVPVTLAFVGLVLSLGLKRALLLPARVQEAVISAGQP